VALKLAIVNIIVTSDADFSDLVNSTINKKVIYKGVDSKLKIKVDRSPAYEKSSSKFEMDTNEDTEETNINADDVLPRSNKQVKQPNYLKKQSTTSELEQNTWKRVNYADSNPMDWSVNQVCSWAHDELRDNGMPFMHVKLLAREYISGSVLMEMELSSYRDIGIPFGIAKVLFEGCSRQAMAAGAAMTVTHLKLSNTPKKQEKDTPPYEEPELSTWSSNSSASSAVEEVVSQDQVVLPPKEVKVKADPFPDD